MRAWPALLLLSCSRPNPAYAVGDAGLFIDMSAGTGTATDTDGSGASTGAPVPTTSSSGATGEVDTGTTGPAVCGPFTPERLAVDPPLPAAQCAAVTQYFGKIAKQGDAAEVSLCLEATCDNCDFFTAPLDPGLAPFVDDGACLRVVHQGIAVVGDPEAPKGCKTTALAIFDDDGVYPLYAASSRVIDAPGFLDSDVRLDVERGGGEACACDVTDCCLEGQARNLRLTFTDHGEAVATLAPGEFVETDLAGARYLVAVVRAHVKGYASTPTQSCVNDPETNFIDWHMLRVQGP